MGDKLLKEIEKGSKLAVMKKRIITHYIYNGSSTITDLAKEMDLSVPTVTKFIDEMCEDGYINDYGKLETSGGRHPSLYGLNAESGYFVGVEVRQFSIHLGLINFKGDSELYIKKMTYMITELKKIGIPLEFNFLGFTAKRNYPNLDFWKIVSKVGNDVVIGLDAHSPSVYDDKENLERAKKYLKSLNITPLDKIEL